jgi:WhiB family transcriptional regulator, redox-sensing transcriptional regulator
MILDLAKETWYVDGLCRNVDASLFFPERGASTRSAKALCRTCPVVEDCLDFFVRHNQEFGVWGGVVGNTVRRKLIKQKSNRV